MFCAENLLRIGSPKAHGLPELHLVRQRHVHLVEQGAELVVGGFENEYALDLQPLCCFCVLREIRIHALQLRRRVSARAV